MASSNKAGGTMSSRLLTMKFMQRAAALPTSSVHGTPDKRSAKRQRLSNGSFNSSPVATPGSDAEVVQAAIDADECKRQQAVDREAARRGETKWVLDVKTSEKPPKPPLVRIVSAGFAALDSPAVHDQDLDNEFEDEDLATPSSGRRRFGTFPAKTTSSKSNDDDDEDGSDPESADAEEGESDSHERRRKVPRTSDAGDTIRAQRDAKRKRDRSQSAQHASQRRSKEVNLNKITSISNAGSGRGSSPITCHQCGKTGHIKARCPQGRR